MVRNQLVGDVDFDDRLLGAGPELLHGLPGLIAELAVGLALEAVEPPQLDLRLPDLITRIRRQYRRSISRRPLARLGGPLAPGSSILRQLNHAAPINRASRQRVDRNCNR